MKYPIIQVKTKDGLWLHGLFIEAEEPRAIFINVHGTASNFYEEDFIRFLAEGLVKEKISMLSTNNRGAEVYDAYDCTGAAVELFEDCLKDIDAWIKFAIEKGHTKIILSGHSLGTEKVVYYMNKGKYRKNVSGIILLAPASSPGYNFYGDDCKPSAVDKRKVEKLLQTAQKLINAGKGDEFLERTAYSGIMPKSAKSFVNTLGQNTEIFKALPFHSVKLKMYSTISVPIFVAIGDQHEYTAIPQIEALNMMERENQQTEAHYLKNCDHDFTDCEKKLAELVVNFVGKNIL